MCTGASTPSGCGTDLGTEREGGEPRRGQGQFFLHLYIWAGTLRGPKTFKSNLAS